MRAVPDPPVRLGAPTSEPCPSIQRAYLGAHEPDGVLVRCGLLKGHHGPHQFHLEWRGSGVSVIGTEGARRENGPRREGR